MEGFKEMLLACVAVMQTEFIIWGFTFSWWEALIWTMVAGVVIWAIWEVLS